ncbi:MAG TPA: PQQ-dependent sugar dehydrogenase, partial [Thermoleophilaceae bacterium]|nr:PQQ-dependent sugar dehydrogenase [Thermoleophilaceae bacterium]
MPHLAAALLTLIALLAPAAAFGQAGVSYGVPADNPFVSEPGAAPEVYALGLRNPYRFSFDRATGDLVIGDVGQSAKEEVDWIGADAVRGANFGWPCREGTVAGHRPDQCPVPGAIEPLFEYDNTGGTAVIGGFVVRDAALTGLEGRYLYADFSGGSVHSLALNFADPDDQPTGVAVPWLASFGEDADGRLYAASLGDGRVVKLVAGAAPGTLAAEDLTGPFDSPVALATYPGDSSRLFVGQLGGQVRLVVDGAVRPTPFLDLTPFGVLVDGERGLLSLVAAPDYE